MVSTVSTMSGETTRPRVLFVDDEVAVLRAFARLLSNEPWDLTFVHTRGDAMRRLAETRFDVVVSDLELADERGADLLGEVMRDHPEIVRVVCSGTTSFEEAARTVPVAHQFVQKSGTGDALRSTLRRATALRALMSSCEMRALVGAGNVLPSAPRLYAALRKKLSDRSATAADIADCIERDVALSARLMQLASSAFFGLPERIRSVRGAVGHLGLSTIESLVLSVEITNMFDTSASARFSVDAIQARALRAAAVARTLSRRVAFADNAFLAAMVHELGLLVIGSRVPETLDIAMEVAERSLTPLHIVLHQMLGYDHAEVGAYLLGIWGIDYEVVDAVLHQNHLALGAQLDTRTVVFLAALLARDPDARLDASDAEHASTVVVLDALGLATRVAELREIAKAPLTLSC